MKFLRIPIKPINNQYQRNFKNLISVLEKIDYLKLKINNNKDNVSNSFKILIFNYYNEKKFKNLLIKNRRRLYNNYEVYPENFEKILLKLNEKDDLNDIDLNDIIIDIRNRKKLKCYFDILKSNIKFNKDYIENLLRIQVLKNDDFLIALKFSNPSLYEIIGKDIFNKSQYLTLLKYFYKQYTCCTPSSFWSGICVLGYDKSFENLYNIEKDIIISRKDINKNIFNKVLTDVTFYINPTIIKKEGFYIYFLLTQNSLKKMKISSNTILDTLYSIKTFKLEQLELILKDGFKDKYNFDVLCSMIKNGLILPYGNCNLGEYSINQFSKDSITKMENSNDKNFSLYLGTKNINDNDLNFEHSVDIYTTLKFNFYSNLKFNRTIEKIYNHILKFGRMSLLEFLHSDYDFNYLSKIRETNYRSWIMPNNPDGKARYLKFKKLILETVLFRKYEKEVKFSWKELKKYLNLDSLNYNSNFEAIYTKSDDLICFEMTSTQIGRLIMRYIKYCPEEIINIQDEFFRGLYKKDNNLQINLEFNTSKDNISFNIPGVENRLSLYYRHNNETINEYTISELYIDIHSGHMVITDKFGKIFNLLFSSTVTSSGHKLYKLLSLIANGKNGHVLNGNGFSRIELELDYQPRISIDNLLISRERFRIDTSELKDISDINLLFYRLLKIFRERNICAKFYYYNDNNYKPIYGQLYTVYDVYLIKNSIKESKKYVYIEEIYPKHKDGEYVSEYWEGIINEK